jgi:predicted permease
MLDLFHDVRFAVRQLLRHPGYTAVAIATLALGLGANTAIFSVVNAYLLKPLPLKNPDRIVQMFESDEGRTGTVSIPDLTDWRNEATLFEGMSDYFSTHFNISRTGAAENVSGQQVSPNFFDVMGGKPAIGRTFAADADHPGNQHVAMLSYALWQRLGSKPDIVGEIISLDSERYEVAGVMPDSFRFPSATAEIWVPLVPDPKFAASRGNRQYFVVGRMKRGIALAQAQAQLDGIAKRLEMLYPDSNKGRGILLVPLQEQLTGRVRQSLYVLLGATAFVFLIACVNVVNLNLTRTASRQREIAVRRAMGATGARLFRQFIVEGLVLTLAGGAAGWLLAQWGVEILAAANSNPLPSFAQIAPDSSVFAFEFGLGLLAALALAVGTAWKATRINVQQTLKEGGRGASQGSSQQRTSKILVVSEVAAAVILLAGAGLMLRTFENLRGVDTGFVSPDRVLTMQVSLPAKKYAGNKANTEFLNPVLSKIAALPGVDSAGAINFLPVQSYGINGDFEIVGVKYPDPSNEPQAEVRAVTSDFYRAMGLPIVIGRTFDANDTVDSEHVAVINQRAALIYWHNQNPIGTHIHISGDESPVYTIVGIVRDSTQPGPGGHVQPEIDVPFTQWPNTWPDLTKTFSIAVHTNGDPHALEQPIRAAVTSVDPQQAVYLVKTMADVIAESTSDKQFDAFFLAVFALVALALAAVGIYGVLSYGVRQRTHEIGVRMALGAEPIGVLGMIVGEGLLLNAIGLAIGLGGAWYLTRFLAALLYGVKPADVTTFVAVGLTLTVIALLACYIPARRAMKVDPMVALRYE